VTPPSLSSPPRLVAFDLDGTLIDSVGDIRSSVNQALVERYGPSGTLPLSSVRGFVGGGARQLIERCLNALGKPAADLEPVFDRFMLVYRARVVETTLLYPGMREALREISRHAKLAVLTNKPGAISRIIVKELGLESHFIGVIGGDDLKSRKPEPEGLLSLCARASVRPDEAALVGDSAVDILTARNAGTLAIGALWGYDRAGVEREGPDVAARVPTDVARLFSTRVVSS
jgi:phosphoglycolate phosphatase